MSAPYSGSARAAPLLAAAFLLAAPSVLVQTGCGGKQAPPSPRRRTPPPPPPAGKPGKVFERGLASWYGPGFHGNRTANGEVYDQYAMTAAHKTLPFNTHVQVHNLDSGKTTVVRINDRGPFIRGRIIDLSRAAARAVDMELAGVARVELRLLGRSPQPPAPADRPGPTLEPVDPAEGRFDVQVGAFAEPANAWRLRERLLEDWPRVHVVRFREFLRVRVGPFEGEAAAGVALRQLEEEGFEPFVVRHDEEEEEEARR